MNQVLNRFRFLGWKTTIGNMFAVGGCCLIVATLVLFVQNVTAHAQTLTVTDTENPSTDDNENPHVWRPQTKSVAIFKNGLGFFLREGDVKLRDGWCLTEQVPPAAFGTLAVYAHQDDEVVDIVGSGPGEVVQFDGRDAADNIKARRERLTACENLKVELKYRSKGEDRTAAGKLLSIGPEFVILDSGSNSLAVPIEGISRLQVLELPLRIHVAEASEAVLDASDSSDADSSSSRSSEESSPGMLQEQLGIENETNRTTTLGMAYLRKGITWIPEYTLKILDDETAELTLRGTIVNQAEDLIHTDVNLIVGVPHFVHTDYMAPLAVGQVIRSVGMSVAPQAITSQIMNRAALVQNAAPVNVSAVESTVTVNTGAEQLNQALGSMPSIGAGGTDYTVYTKKDLTIRRGEKAILTLFVKRIKYGHVYHWDLPNPLKHFMVLNNTTGSAWTTGPCLAITDRQPLAEDLLKYTPKGTTGLMPVTAAINISHERTEREIDRKLKAHSPSSNYYLDLVTLEGNLLLKNFEQRDVTIRITAPMPGKPVEASDGGRLSIDSTKLRLEERAGTASWTVTLKPGEVKTLTYTYERYVRSH